MQHESLVVLAAHVLDLLLIVRGAERAGDERLRLASREHGRAVYARQHGRLRPDRPNLVELAAVQPHASLEHLVPKDLFLQLLEDRLSLDLPLDLRLGHRGDQVLEDLVHAVVVLQLAPQPHRFAERHVNLLLDLAVELVADRLFLDRELLLARGARERIDAGDDLLERRVRGVERAHDFGLGDLLRARLHHDDAVKAASDDEVELALFPPGRTSG